MLPREPSPTFPPNPRPPALWVYVAATLAYLTAFYFGVWSVVTAGKFAPVWPATGLAIWLVVRFGPGMLVAVALGELVPRLLGSTQVTSVGIMAVTGTGNVLTAYFGAWLWRRVQGSWQDQLGDFCEPVACAVTALAAPVVTAAMGVSAVVLWADKPPAEILGLACGWWTGDAAGALFLLPLLLAAPGLGQRMRTGGTAALGRMTLIVALAGLVSWLAFWYAQGSGFLFVLFPLLVLAAGWLGAPGTRVVALLIGVVGIVSAALGHNPLSSGNIEEDLRSIQLFLTAIAFVTLLLPPLHARLNLLRARPLLLLLGGWVLSALLYAQVRSEQQRREAADFAQLTVNAEREIGARLTTYLDALRSGVGLVRASRAVERGEWETFVATMDLPRRYPAVSGIGFIRPVPPPDTKKFLERVRADGAPDFAIHAVPGGTESAGHEQFVLTYFEPLAGNEPVLGLDLATEPARREAAETARDTGEPRMTGRITLEQESGKRPSFLLFLPVYEKGAPVATVAERRAALRAWIDAPFVTERFLRDVLGSRLGTTLQLDFFEEGPPDAAHLLFASGPPRASLPLFARVTSLELAGQKFTLGWHRGPDFGRLRQSPLIWLAVSLAVATVLLAGWLLSLQSFREQAEALVVERTVALRESEQRFHLANRAVFNVIWDQKLPSGVIWWNEHFQAVYGHPADRAAHSDFWRDCLHPDDRERVIAGVKATFESDRDSWADSYRFRRADGTYADVDDRALIVREGGGRPVRMIGAMQDITARKQAEAALREGEERYRGLVETAFDGSLLHQDGIVVDANAAYAQMFGYTVAELLGKPVLELSAPAVRATVAAIIQRCDETPYESVGLRKDGSWVAIETAGRACTYHGRPARLAAVRDISERKQAEAVLRQSEARLHTLFEHSPSGIWDEDFSAVRAHFDQLRAAGVVDFRAHFSAHPVDVVHCAGLVKVRDTNRQACRILAAATKADIITHLPSYFTAAAQEVFREELITLAEGGTEYAGEIPLRLPSGQNIVCEFHLAVVPGAEETLAQVLFAFRDITARKQLEREKTSVEAQLRQSQKLDAIGQLAGGIAHDFNNLLTGILGNTALLQDSSPVAPKMQQELLQQISQAGQRAASLTRQLLLFSRREQPESRDLDLNEAVGELLKVLRRTLGEHIYLHLVCSPQPQIVHADPVMLDQILLNLALNARDAMPAGGQLTISTESVVLAAPTAGAELTEWQGVDRRRAARGRGRRNSDITGADNPAHARAGEFTCLSVIDAGCGMSPEVKAHIFEPFFSTKEVGKGTGLGLATVYGIVQQHQGWIEVESQPGAGSTFRIYLPRVQATPAPAAEDPLALVDLKGRGETILVVEDELSVGNLLRIWLERAGYRVIGCPSGAEALTLWPRHRGEVKLLITDMVMPGGISGVQLAQKLLQDQPGLKVIIISGYSATLSNDRKKFDVEIDFIPKPFVLQNVLTTVRTRLDAQQVARS